MKTVAQLLNAKQNQQVYTIGADEMVLDALRLMAEKNIGALLVVNHGEVVGVVSERDYARKMVLKGRSSIGTPISAIMSAPVVSVDSKQSVDTCMNLMTDRHLRHLPVVEDGQLLGLLSIGDLVKAAIAEQAEADPATGTVHPRRLKRTCRTYPFPAGSRDNPRLFPLRAAAMSSPLKIRRYIPADRDATLAIWLEASRVGHGFLGEAELQKQKALVRDHYLDASETWLALDGDTPLGFIGLLDAFIGGLFVAPTAHGRGIGRQLVEHAATLKGALEVEVYAANREALGFYARCGFVESGRRPRDDEGRALEIVQLRREH